MQVSPCHPRSSIFATATAMPALIFSALKPGGRAGSEKSTVSGFCPTNNTLVIWWLLLWRWVIGGPSQQLVQCDRQITHTPAGRIEDGIGDGRSHAGDADL